MATIQHEIVLEISADAAWAALRRVDLAHRLFAGVLQDGCMKGNIRTVAFANGLRVRERILDVSDRLRRVAYAVIEGAPMTHHNASMQVFPEGAERCRFVWTADFLPDDYAGAMQPMMIEGTEALKRNLETGAFVVD